MRKVGICIHMIDTNACLGVMSSTCTYERPEFLSMLSVKKSPHCRIL